MRHNRLNSEKRLKLMCTPLKSLQAKTIEIATNKFQAWWYVICNVQENVENYISMVFEPFLQFCFGQMFPTPNLRLRKNETATQVKRCVIYPHFLSLPPHLIDQFSITIWRLIFFSAALWTFHGWQSQRFFAYSTKATNKLTICLPNFR